MRSNPLSRRAILRGLGATVALPWLESSAVFADEPATPATAGPPRRFACLFFGDGINTAEWTFAGDGAAMQLGRAFDPLAALKHKLLFVNGLRHTPGMVGHHSKGAAGMLTGTPPSKGSTIRCATSLDQLLAEEVGGQTMLPSLVLACERPVSGFHESQYSMVYASHLSWSSPTSPVPSEIFPALAFDSLFASAGSRSQLSVLDHVFDQYRDVQARASTADRVKLDEYGNSVREIEKRLQRLAATTREESADLAESRLARPADALPNHIDEHSRLMCDIIALAFQTDRTRIATLLLANDLSGQIYPFLGLRDDHHSYSHNHKGEPYQKIVRFWVEQYAYLLGRLDAMPEGEGTVLDHSCIMLCNEHWVAHDPAKIPLILGGGLDGTFRTGRCCDYEKAKERRMSSLLLDVSHGMGVPLASFGDSDRRLGI